MSKTAPIREITQHYVRGKYGTREHIHVLNCGHTLSKSRRAPQPRMRCWKCEGEYNVGTEVELATLRLKLAAALDITEDAVLILSSGAGELREARVSLSPDAVRRLTRGRGRRRSGASRP